MPRKVLVSGCFDLLHSGHIAFFREAASFGDLYVAVGSDRTIYELKGRPTINNEEERLYMVRSIEYVKDAFVSGGSGILDFAKEARELRPDVFVVNTEGNTPDKRTFFEELGTTYKVLRRTPHADLPARSTTALRQIDRIPYRIDLAGGWLDQPFVSRHHAGAVVTVSIEPTIEFNERSGMATSTRRCASDLWGARLPIDHYEKLAKVLFCYDNPPGTREISGAQDAIGIVYPGLARSHYEGAYWPSRIDHICDERSLAFVEQSLYLVPLGPRHDDYDVLSDTHITADQAARLADAADECWRAASERDVERLGSAVLAGFEAQIAMFPRMVNDTVRRLVDRYRDAALGWKLSGAGGGGYLVLVSDVEIEDAVRVVVRRCDD